MNFLKKAKKALSPEDAFSGTVAIKLAQGGLFAPGERVGGELIWTRDKPCAIRNIVATLNGTLRCPKFREPGGLRILLDSTGRLVYQSPRGSNKPQVLEKGVSEFPFSLPDLPPAAHGLPDSFMWDEEGLCASYWIEFVFWTADKKKHVCRAPFVQMRPVPDLRKLPLQSSKIPSLFKAPNHKISMSVAQMPPIVHPGQQIDFDFRIVNCSTKTATCLSIQLERRTQLHGKKQVKTVASAIFNADHGFNLPRLPKGLDPTSSQDIAPKVERVFTLQIPSNLADLPNTWDFRTILSVKYSLTISLMLGSSRWTVKNPVVLRETDPLSMIASVPVSPPQQAPEPYSHRPAPPPPTGHYPPHQPSRPRSSTSPPGAQADYYAQPFGPPPGGPPPDYPGYYYPPPAASGPYMYPPAGEPFPPPPFVQHAYHPGPDYFPPSSSTSPLSPPYTPDFTPSSSSTPVLSQPRTYYPPPLPAQSSLPTMPTHPHTQTEQSPSPLYPVLDYPPAPWSHSPHPYPSDHYTSLPHSWTPPPAEFTIKPSAPPIDA